MRNGWLPAHNCRSVLHPGKSLILRYLCYNRAPVNVRDCLDRIHADVDPEPTLATLRTLTPRRLGDHAEACRYRQSADESTLAQRVVTTRATTLWPDNAHSGVSDSSPWNTPRADRNPHRLRHRVALRPRGALRLRSGGSSMRLHVPVDDRP